MALSKATLKAEILKLIDPDDPNFVGYPTTIAQAAENWRDAFDDYAEHADDMSADTIATKFPATFKSTLQTGLTGSWTRADGADAFADAWRDYFNGCTFALGTLISGTGSPCANEGSGTKIFISESSSVELTINRNPLDSALYVEFGIFRTIAAKADELAQIFHDASQEDIEVRIDGLDTTIPTPLPVWNICTVF